MPSRRAAVSLPVRVRVFLTLLRFPAGRKLAINARRGRAAALRDEFHPPRTIAPDSARVNSCDCRIMRIRALPLLAPPRADAKPTSRRPRRLVDPVDALENQTDVRHTALMRSSRLGSFQACIENRKFQPELPGVRATFARDVLPAPFHYRALEATQSCNMNMQFYDHSGETRVTYVHGRVMCFVPGEPGRAYSAGKLHGAARARESFKYV